MMTNRTNEHTNDPLNCTCNGWCDCHKPGWPKGETCDCRQRTDAEKEAERAESERVARALGVGRNLLLDNPNTRTAILDTLKRLNWLYGRGEVENYLIKPIADGMATGTAFAKCPRMRPHTFTFSWDGKTVRALGHQSRLKGMIRVEVSDAR